MEISEALALAKQLGIPAPATWGDFFKALDERELDLAVDDSTGDWVISKQNQELARAA